MSPKCEDIARRQVSASQEKGFHQVQNQRAPLSLTKLASRTVRNKVLLFKPSSLWSFVLAARAA